MTKLSYYFPIHFQIHSADLLGSFGQLFCTVRTKRYHTGRCLSIRNGNRFNDRIHLLHIACVHLVCFQDFLQNSCRMQWPNLSQNVATAEIVIGRWTKWSNHQFAEQWFAEIWICTRIATWSLERANASTAVPCGHLLWNRSIWHCWHRIHC